MALSATRREGQRTARPKVLVIDIGGTRVKALVSGERRWRAFFSGPDLTPQMMVARAKRMVRGWSFDVITIGYPGQVTFAHIVGDPPNLAKGWIGFDFEAAFGCPVKVVNDAALPAIGSYKGGSMLYLGLGTGLGTAMIVDGVLEVLTLDRLPYRGNKSYGDYLAKRSIKWLGRERWEKHVHATVRELKAFFKVEYVVLGGGNVNELGHIPKDVVLAQKRAAFIGGAALWRAHHVVIGQPILEQPVIHHPGSLRSSR